MIKDFKQNKRIVKYWFDGKKFHTTTLKYTKKYVYSKNSLWRSASNDVYYKTKKTALQAYLRNVKGLIDNLKKQHEELGQKIAEQEKDYKRLDKKYSTF